MKIDLHTHSYYSHDAVSSPRDLIKSALEKGIDGIALTDHDTIKGWPEAIEAAKEFGLILILGEEIRTQAGDIIGLFLAQEIKEKDPFKAIQEIKKQGGLVIIPHPFDFLEGFKQDLDQHKEEINGIEVFNSQSLWGRNKKAIEFAQKNNLAMVAGSDAHYYKCVGNAYTIVDGAKTLDEFKTGILKRGTKTKGRRSFPLYFIFPTLARLGFKAGP